MSTIEERLNEQDKEISLLRRELRELKLREKRSFIALAKRIGELERFVDVNYTYKP